MTSLNVMLRKFIAPRADETAALEEEVKAARARIEAALDGDGKGVRELAQALLKEMSDVRAAGK